MKLPRTLLLATLATFSATSALAQEDAPPAEAAAPDTGPKTYAIDSANTVLIVRTYKGGVAGALAHDHAIRSMKTTGNITWADGGEGCKFDITVDVPSFRVDADGDRKIMGLEGTVDPGQVEDIKKNMYAADQLNVGAHKTMTFKAESCTGNTANGTLTIVGKGVAKSVPLTITADDTSFRAKGELNFLFTEFGITPYSTGFGAIRNEDKLMMKIDIKAKR